MVIWASYNIIFNNIVLQYCNYYCDYCAICQGPAVVRRVWRASGGPTVTTAALYTVPMATAATRRQVPVSAAMDTGDPPVRRVSDETDSYAAGLTAVCVYADGLSLLLSGCSAGWHGDQCSTPCPSCGQSYHCDHVTGECDCPPGYTGPLCDQGT